MSVSKKVYDSWSSVVGGTISLFSPTRAWRYHQARNSYRAYSAASKTGADGYWRPRNKSGDAELRKAFPLILARCRELAQSNPFIKGAIRKIVNNTVRNGIVPQLNLKLSDGTLDKARNDEIEARYKRWQKKGTADVSGHDSVAGIQQLVLRHTWSDGEFLIHRVFDRSAKKGVLPLRLELLECDYLDDSQDGALPNGNIVRRGIEMNHAGRPIAYYLFDNHPGDYASFGRPKGGKAGRRLSLSSSRRIPATDVIHIFERERASMSRGVSWMAAIAMEAYSFADYQSYERTGAKLAAAFGVFVKSQFPEVFGPASNPLGGNAVNQASGDKVELPDFIEAGRIQKLPYGTDIAIASHKRPGDSYEPYTRVSLRGQSVGTGMSYEAYSNDYTGASYSSARSATLEERLSYKGQQFFLNEQCNDDLGLWFLEALAIAEPKLLPKFVDDPYWYTSAISWQEPGWGWVDPMKDASAAEKELKLCLNNHHNLSAQRGLDWDANMDQLERELERMLPIAQKKAEISKLIGAVYEA